MKLNNKGFMMAEVVVVSVIICTVLITLYTSLLRINEAYATRNRYYDINTLYFTEEINNLMIYNGTINNLLADGNSNTININDLSLDNNKLSSIYNITEDGYIRLYFSPYNQTKVEQLNSLSNISNTFKDYVNYISGHFDFTEDYTYILTTEICKTKDDCYYYGLKVR